MSSQPRASGYRAVRTEQIGSACVVTDDSARTSVRLPTGRSLAELWRSDQLIPSVERDHTTTPFPGVNGARLWLLEIPPDDETHGHPLHGTATVDAGFILEGVVDLELDDGTVTPLSQGDAFVQLGGAHRWVNRSNSTAVLGVIVIGTGSPQAAPAQDGGR
jgi:hypothetical protein